MGQAERSKRAAWVQAIWLLSDLAAIAGGFAAGYWLRFLSPLTRLLPPEKGIPGISLYLAGAAVTALIWIPLQQFFGLYRLERGRRRHRTADLLRAQGFGVLAVAALTFFYRDETFSRIAMPLVWACTFLLTLAGRRGVHLALRIWRPFPPIRFAVAGGGVWAERVSRALSLSSYPHRFAGVIRLEGAADRASGEASSGGPATLGSIDQIEEIARRADLDLVVLAPADGSTPLLPRLYAQCQKLDLDLLFLPDLSPVWGRAARVEEIDGLPLLRLREPALSGWGRAAKRTLDLFVSLALLLFLSPLFALLAVAVRLDSPGPVFHRQERVGRDRRVFRMLKFRSMRVDAESSSGPVWASAEDPRRTRSGVFLRRWSLDELPQLWNVLCGEMSLVGPRPERPFFVEQFEAGVADYYDRHRVKSGMTGWAQIHGLRGDTPIEERTRYDLYYVENWSVWLDLRILFLTAWAVVRHRGS